MGLAATFDHRTYRSAPVPECTDLREWTEDCWEGDCGRRVLRGGSWDYLAEFLRPGARFWIRAGYRSGSLGFRVSRTLD